MNIFFCYPLLIDLSIDKFSIFHRLVKHQTTKNRTSKAVRESLLHKTIKLKFERKIIVVLTDMSKHQGHFIKEVRMC